MFNEAQKQLALNFARALSQRDYPGAYEMCSEKLKSHVSLEVIRNQFEDMIPQDWGDVNPIELEDQLDFPFIYVVLGGDVYSEAIIIDAFVVEQDQVRIDHFEFGRP